MSTLSPPGLPRASLEGTLARLRGRFLEGYLDQHIEIIGLYDALRRGVADETTPAQVVQILHRIGGTAGTLGLARLSEAARTAERALYGMRPDEARGLAGQTILYAFLKVSAEVADRD